MRARNIKPGLFKNEDLAECEPLARILFTGLWCYCDREGRFEWRPKRIKIEVLPYDECDIEGLLNQLNRKNLIGKYEINNSFYGHIPKFLKHQNPHVKEKESSLPAPPENNLEYQEDSESTIQVPDLNQTSTIQTQDENPLNPESLILNPESLNPDKRLLNSSQSVSKDLIDSLKNDFPNIDVDFQLEKYLHYQEERPKSKQHKNKERGFRNWIKQADKWRGGKKGNGGYYNLDEMLKEEESGKL